MKPQEFRGQVTAFKMLTPTVFELAFEPEQPIGFKAGQFVSMIIPGAGPQGRDLRRAYSVASPPESKQIELCVKIVEDGPGTQYLARLRPGDPVRGFASYGSFVFEPKAQRSLCFIATGTGIAPFRSMILSQDYLGQIPVRGACLLGVRTEDEVLYEKTFSESPQMTFIPAISRPSAQWKGFRGRVTDYLKEGLLELSWLDTEFYLCGHGGMIQEVKAMLLEKGVSKESVHLEIYYK